MELVRDSIKLAYHIPLLKDFPLLTSHDFNRTTALFASCQPLIIYIYKVEGPGGGVLQIREKENTAPEDALRVYKVRGLSGGGARRKSLWYYAFVIRVRITTGEGGFMALLRQS